MGSGERRIERREVDEFGLVDCRDRDHPTLADCAVCTDLVGVSIDEDDRVVAVRCRSRIRPLGRGGPEGEAPR
jgi:hypothetical protein